VRHSFNFSNLLVKKLYLSAKELEKSRKKGIDCYGPVENKKQMKHAERKRQRYLTEMAEGEKLIWGEGTMRSVL